jgi:hypothetical protein
MYTVSPYSALAASVGTIAVAASASAARRVPRNAALGAGTSSPMALTRTVPPRASDGRATRATRGDAREMDGDATVVFIALARVVVVVVVANVESVMEVDGTARECGARLAMPSRDAVDGVDDDDARASGENTLTAWFLDKAARARDKARATVAKVKEQRTKRMQRSIETESRAHAARVARAIAGDDSHSRGSSFGETKTSRREALMEALGRDEVDAERLRLLVSDGGVPDDDNGRARALVWKLCLGYLPRERARWEEATRAKRAEYATFRDEFCASASTSDESKWIDGYEDDELAEQIDRDIARVHPDMHFFNDEGEDGEARRRKDHMRDALYVFAKLNPGVGYVQGMHEMFGCMYYVFATSTDEESATENAAADAFYCFTEVFSEFRDVFVMALDATDQGVRAMLDTLSVMLAEHGPEVHAHLQSMNLSTSMFAFRWITLMFTQDFEMADVLRLWDVVLASPRSRKECLLRLCVACVLNIGTELIDGDFAACMKMLQNYPPVDVRNITRLAATLPYGIAVARSPSKTSPFDSRARRSKN